MSQENIKPLGENVLIRMEKQNKKTESGIYLPDTSEEERPEQGRVVAVGDSLKIKVKKNQKVIFAKYSGTEINISGEKFLIVKNDNILAVIEK